MTALLVGVGVVAATAISGTGDGSGGDGTRPAATTTTTADRAPAGAAGGSSTPTTAAGADAPGVSPGAEQPARLVAALVGDRTRIVVADVVRGTIVREVARADEGSAYGSVAASGAGSVVAFVQARPGSTCEQPGDVFVAVGEAAPHRIGTGGRVVVSRDGRRLAYTVGGCEGDPDALVVRSLADGAEVRHALSPRPTEPDGLVSSIVAWLPTGDRVAYVWAPDPAESLRLLTLDISSGAVAETGIERPDGATAWTALAGTADGTVLLATSEADLERGEIRGALEERRLSDGAVVADVVRTGSVIVDITADWPAGCHLYVVDRTLRERCGTAERRVMTDVLATAALRG